MGLGTISLTFSIRMEGESEGGDVHWDKGCRDESIYEYIACRKIHVR
jgi:hypothetical protein